MRRGIITFRSIAATATPLGTDDRAGNDGAFTSNYRALSLGRPPRDLDLRQLDELVDGGARHAQPHAAEAAARQIEAVHAVHRSGHARPPIERRERVLLRHEQVLDLDVVAARAPHAADVPGVDDLDL